MKIELTVKTLQKEAKKFSEIESSYQETSLYGVTDGKAVGTYFEHKFQLYLHKKYQYIEGSSAKGIDFPELMVDMKVTSKRQPQSSCPFKSARQKIYGLGYSLLIFVYNKTDNHADKTGMLDILDVIYIDASRTGDFQTTSGLVEILKNNGNKEDILAFFEDRNLPVDDIMAEKLASELLLNRPIIGYLTISNALQWRLQYTRAISKAGEISGINKVI